MVNYNFKNTLNKEVKSEDKLCARLAYKCGICGTEYENVVDRAKCEIGCARQQEEEKRLAAEKKKAEEKATRKKEVDGAFERAYELAQKYIKDYGEYNFKCSMAGTIDDIAKVLFKLA